MLGAALLLLNAGGALFGANQASLHALLEEYHRPAAIPYPKDDPYSHAKYELGRTLFFDPLLSGSKVRSCSSCHNPGLSWADGQPRAIGEKQLPLRTPTLLNVAWTPKLGWDGHFSDLEHVAIGPITSPDNMDLPEKALLDRLAAIPGYVSAFDAAFGKGKITMLKVERHWPRSNVRSYRTRHRSTVGSAAIKRRSAAAAKRGFICSTATPIAPPATAVGRLPTCRFTTSAWQETTISAAAGNFRRR